MGTRCNAWFIGPTQIFPNNISIGLATCIAHGSVPIFYNGLQPQKLPLPLGDRGSHLIHSSLDTPSQNPKWYLDGFSLFCRAHERDFEQTHMETDRHTDRLCHQPAFVAVGRHSSDAAKKVKALNGTSRTQWIVILKHKIHQEPQFVSQQQCPFA